MVWLVEVLSNISWEFFPYMIYRLKTIGELATTLLQEPNGISSSSDPTRKFNPRSKVNRPENVFLFYVYRTDITRPEAIHEPVDNQKWENWTQAVTDFSNRYITVNRDYPNLIMADLSHIRPESCSRLNSIRLKPT